MGIALHGHGHHWHWLHAAGRPWHGHGVAAGVTATGLLVLLAGVVLVRERGATATIPGDRVLVQTDISRDVPPLLDAREAALARAEQALSRAPTPAARLDAARCAWELAVALPSDQDAQYRALLVRAAALLADPAVIEILAPRDRSLKAHVAVELAAVMDLPAGPR
jgi:hypothetical protein